MNNSHHPPKVPLTPLTGEKVQRPLSTYVKVRGKTQIVRRNPVYGLCTSLRMFLQDYREVNHR